MADMEEAEENMAEQERWGLTRTDMVVQRLVRLVKVARARLAEQDDRLDALEARVTMIEDA